MQNTQLEEQKNLHGSQITVQSVKSRRFLEAGWEHHAPILDPCEPPPQRCWHRHIPGTAAATDLTSCPAKGTLLLQLPAYLTIT